MALVLSVALLGASPAARPPEPGQPEPAQEGGAAAANVRHFNNDGGMVLNFIKSDKTAEFEEVMAALKQALAKSDKPERQKQAAGWKVFKSPDPAGANVLYVDGALYARDGAAAAGLRSGVTLRNVGGAAVGGTVELNDAGTPLFLTNVEGTGVTPENNSVIYLGNKPMARTGVHAPIFGATFASFASGDLASNRTTRWPTTRMPMPTVAPDQAMPPYSCSQKWATIPMMPTTTRPNAA